MHVNVSSFCSSSFEGVSVILGDSLKLVETFLLFMDLDFSSCIKNSLSNFGVEVSSSSYRIAVVSNSVLLFRLYCLLIVDF